MAKIQSVEPNVADLANGWLKSYKLDYKLEQESLNTEIDQALNDYYSKNGGVGGNRPDAKLLLQDKNLGNYPILIEYKGYKDKLVKLDVDGKVANKTSKNQPDFKNINSYAVNGAVHYANALLHYTSYTDIIAIGMTGYKNDAGKLEYEIGVYYVSKSNFGIGQKVDEYTDFSFLKKSNFDGFIEKVKRLQLSQEDIEKLREHREQEINASLVKLNNDIYNNEKGLSERDRVYLVAASIIATLGVPGKVAALEKSELKSSTEEGNRDGDIILRKIKAFLSEKNLPQEKRDLIVRTLQNTLTTDNINKVENGESQLKRVFTKIIDDLGIYYKIGLSTDFTGKLFNEMYSWLGFSQDKLNDVVLTPSYVATLLARLARVNKDSYVWDFATGSAGLLVAAMNEMLIDAKEQIKSPDEFALKSAQIKANQLLGLEILSEVYMLAILNMILMGDGSSNILNKDSLKEFNGNYGFTIIMGSSDLTDSLISKYSCITMHWISFIILLAAILYLLVSGIDAIKVLFNENTMSTVKLSNLATNDVDTKEKYDDCTNRNISQNIIRNNIVYSSYICIRNALICVLVLFVLVSIPFTTAKSKDNNMMDSSESSISYSETIIIPDSIGVTDVSNCIIQDREARNSIEDGMIYSFVNTNKNYYVQYKCFGSEIIVEKLFCFDKVING